MFLTDKILSALLMGTIGSAQKTNATVVFVKKLTHQRAHLAHGSREKPLFATRYVTGVISEALLFLQHDLSVRNTCLI